MLALIVINLIIGFSGNIDWRDHLGGLVVGVVLATAYDRAFTLRPEARQLTLTIGSSVAVLLVLAVLVKAVPPGHMAFPFS